MLISIDCETTGVDRAHGARPFLVTICQGDGQQFLWEFDVDPKTREVHYNQDDIDEINYVIGTADEICGHNIRFDVEHLHVANIVIDWPWHKTYCTLIAGHLLASGMPHNLTSMALQYLAQDILPHEEELKEAVISARRTAKTFSKSSPDDLFAESTTWRIAKEDDPTMPSAGGDAWHFDYWLPRAVAKHLGYDKNHPWWTVCSKYANIDSAITVALWKKLKRQIHDRGFWPHFSERMKLLPIIKDMEIRGVSYDAKEGDAYLTEYRAEVENCSTQLREVAKKFNYDLDVPNGSGVNHSLRRFCFGYTDHECENCNSVTRLHSGQPLKCSKCKESRFSKSTPSKGLGLVPGVDGYTEAGNPSLDDACLTYFLATLQDGPQKEFIQALATKKATSTSINYLQGYGRYAIWSKEVGFWVLHPNLNPTSTSTLRMSSNQPNAQNVGKGKKPCRRCNGTGVKEERDCQSCGGEGEVNHNLRRAFRPAPGREFWAFDYENLEMMIPGYKAGQKEWIDLFEKPNEPPYWGSQHLLNASIIFPEQFWPLADIPPSDPASFKKRYADSFYGRIKAFDFALNYQCGEATGDESAGVVGAWRKVKDTLKELTKYNDYWVSFAKRNGYVETVPDKTVDPTKGYPIMVTRGGGGDVSPTVPLNFHVQSTAMWCTCKAMIRTHDQCKEWTRDDPRGYYLALQIHDEILFDFPEGGRRNLARALRIKHLMEESGRDIGVPLRVSMSYHPHSWAESEKIAT